MSIKLCNRYDLYSFLDKISVFLVTSLCDFNGFQSWSMVSMGYINDFKIKLLAECKLILINFF